MRSIIQLSFIFISTCFFSCDFVRDKKIIGSYHIVAVDDLEESCLAYMFEDGNSICIVPDKVLAFCKTDEHIFLKQSPFGGRDTTNINYYIVSILKDDPAIYPEASIIGPLKQQKFNEEISKRNIKNLNFEEID